MRGYLMLLAVVGVLGAGGNEPFWQPYRFKGTEHFEYKVMQEEDGKTTEGSYVIDLSREGEKYAIQLNGKFGDMEGQSTLRVKSAEEIQGQLFAQMLFNPWLAPLTITLFAQTFTFMPFAAMGAEPGSRSVQKNKDGETVEFLVETCSFQGKEGRKYVAREEGEVVYESCVVKDIALPVGLRMVDRDEGTRYTLELVKYAP